MPGPDGRAARQISTVDQDYWNLRVFCVVAEQQSVSLAAKQLSMSQSGVSMLLHRLARRLGVRLTRQSRKRLVLTAAGVELYRHSLDTLRSATAMDARLRFLKGESGGLVVVATRAFMATHFLPPVLIELSRAHADVEVGVVEVPQSIIVLRDVLNSGVDFAA